MATATFQRLPDDTTTAGPLDATDAYATAAATFYDAVGRTVEQVNYGREDTASGLPHNFFDATTGQLINVNGDGIPDAAQGIPPAPELLGRLQRASKPFTTRAIRGRKGVRNRFLLSWADLAAAGCFAAPEHKR